MQQTIRSDNGYFPPTLTQQVRLSGQGLLMEIFVRCASIASSARVSSPCSTATIHGGSLISRRLMLKTLTLLRPSRFSAPHSHPNLRSIRPSCETCAVQKCPSEPVFTTRACLCWIGGRSSRKLARSVACFGCLPILLCHNALVVPHIVSLHPEDNVFRNVCRVVGNTLECPADHQRIQGLRSYLALLLHHFCQRF